LAVFGGRFVATGQESTPESQVEQGDERSFPAAIYEGACESLGEKAIDLAPVGIPEGGELVGEPAIAAYESVTTVPETTLQAWIDGDYAVAVSRSVEAAGEVVACGLIGGIQWESNLLFGLGPVGEPEFGGVAKMTEADGAVTVTIHLMPGVLGFTAPVASPEAVASPVASPIPGEEPADPEQETGGQESQVGQQEPAATPTP
jgi:hypothetical protein